MISTYFYLSSVSLCIFITYLPHLNFFFDFFASFWNTLFFFLCPRWDMLQEIQNLGIWAQMHNNPPIHHKVSYQWQQSWNNDIQKWHKFFTYILLEAFWGGRRPEGRTKWSESRLQLSFLSASRCFRYEQKWKKWKKYCRVSPCYYSPH